MPSITWSVPKNAIASLAQALALPSFLVLAHRMSAVVSYACCRVQPVALAWSCCLPRSSTSSWARISCASSWVEQVAVRRVPLMVMSTSQLLPRWRMPSRFFAFMVSVVVGG